MNNKMNQFIILLIIIFASATRLIPHPPNFTPIIAMGLLGGAYIKNRLLIIIIPIGSMFISDIFLGFHGVIYWVYGSLILVAFLGKILITNVNIKNCSLGVLIGSFTFFIITNFGVWLTSGYYPISVNGIIVCYTMALPFFINTLASSVFYSIVMFGGYELIIRNIIQLAPSRIQR